MLAGKDVFSNVMKVRMFLAAADWSNSNAHTSLLNQLDRGMSRHFPIAHGATSTLLRF